MCSGMLERVICWSLAEGQTGMSLALGSPCGCIIASFSQGEG